jgi:leader peptidase (prepilin peptidase) / N-methyltransferase
MNAIAATEIIKGLLILALIYLAYKDLKTFLLPDIWTLPLVFFGILNNGIPELQLVSLKDSILGALLGYLSLWSLNALYRWFKRREGIGMGDAKLLAALGAWLGLSQLPFILLIASITGLLGGLLWIKFQRQNFGSAFPFGPFLIFAGIIELLWPQTIQNMLMSNLT